MAFTEHILVPTDFSDASRLALRAARLLAEQFDARITLLHVHDPEALRPPATLGYTGDDQRRLEAEVLTNIRTSLEELRDGPLGGLERVSMAIVHESAPARAIVHHAADAGCDLIVMSTHGRTGLQHLLIGSVAERVVRHATVPVITLRSTAKD
ncbi:MAG: universal stress protein [Sandaracinaceae bacterium]